MLVGDLAFQALAIAPGTAVNPMNLTLDVPFLKEESVDVKQVGPVDSLIGEIASGAEHKVKIVQQPHLSTPGASEKHHKRQPKQQQYGSEQLPKPLHLTELLLCSTHQLQDVIVPPGSLFCKPSDSPCLHNTNARYTASFLPEIAQRPILQHLVELGGVKQLRHLRLCNSHWKVACDAQILSIGCGVEEMGAAIPFMQQLPALTTLIIRGSTIIASTLGENSLYGLDAKLKKLTLAGVPDMHHWGGWIGSPSMQLASLGSLLLSFSQSLTTLHITACIVENSSNQLTLSTPGFFSWFPLLADLSLDAVKSTPVHTCLDLGDCMHLKTLRCKSGMLESLDVTMCKQLVSLDCSHNSLSSLDLSECVIMTELVCEANRIEHLDVSACSQLTSLHCSNNQLKTLDASVCLKLLNLDCCRNHLQTLVLPTHAELNTLNLSNNLEILTLVGDPLPLHLCCEWTSFNQISPAAVIRAHNLELLGLVTGPLAGFKKLQHMECAIGDGGSINLSGCQDVDLALSSERYSFSLLGKSAVRKLTLSGFLCLDSFAGFTTLTDLHCAVSTYQLQHLDLSECHSLHTACLIVDWYPTSGMYTTLITGSRSLEQLTCNGFSSLLKLDVSLCSLLTALTVRGSSLTRMDVSFCPILRSLDVSDSALLKVLYTGSLQFLKRVTCRNCPRLEGF